MPIRAAGEDERIRAGQEVFTHYYNNDDIAKLI